MASEVLERYKQDCKQLTLVPAAGGLFELEMNGEVVFSKSSLDRFPHDGEVLKAIEARRK